MKTLKTTIAVATAIVMLSALVATASARNISITETRYSVTFPRVEFSGGFGTTRCNLTLGKVYHARTHPKVLETLVGLITGASIGSCETGSATILSATFPWHRRYAGFIGTLPNITGTSIKIIGMAFQIREPVFGVTCLATSTATSPVTLTSNREGGGRVTSIRLGGTINTNCGFAGTLSGTSNSITPALTITLI